MDFAKTIAALLASLYGFRGRINSEETFVRRTLTKRAARNGKLLDVGCGHGRFYDITVSAGLEYMGVDINPATVSKNREQGRDVYHDADLQAMSPMVNVLLFSHVIEHFDYADLVRFLDRYLRCLKVGGLVIVLTPLYHRGFYDDFDHVKPYNPEALRQMFCRSTSQTREISLQGTYSELNIWFKRDPVWHTYRTGRWCHLFGAPLSLASTLSFGLLGKLTGYGMVLQRVS